ncbi:MAG: 4-hydroxythreonine-4-phosphate dehydrogenase PdxA [Planctomycetota bacterium]|jgi:4-hydroxythreonine-4-phosphate dehydrogenase
MGTATRKVRLAITAGDPFGIGPEVVRGALARLPGDCEATVFGDPALFPGVERVSAVAPAGEPPEPRGPDARGGEAALLAIEAALAATGRGEHDALVTAPISKEACVLAGQTGDGHTPLLARAFGAQSLMTFVWDPAEPVVALLTHHIPLRAVASTLTSDLVERGVRILDASLRSDFGCATPKIGVLGLNPHAGEHGRLGTEEEDFVVPALERLREAGIDVEGPLPGDAAFAVRARYDALLALYHDQGLAPVKALAFDRAVNVTLGLPVVRTSPAHGTAFDIAGRGEASSDSMVAALEWAVRLARARSCR